MSFFYDGYDYTVSVAPNSYYPTLESMFTIYLGVQNKSRKTDYPAKAFQASKVVQNANYDANTNINDIAIILLSNEVQLNQFINIACLPQAGYFPNNTNIDSFIVGWGDLYGNKTYPVMLQNAKIEVYNSSMCVLVFPTVSKDWNSQICAGTSKIC